MIDQNGTHTHEANVNAGSVALDDFQAHNIVSNDLNDNKAGYTAIAVACGWAGSVLEKVTGAFWQEH